MPPIEESVSVTDASRRFSEILRRVRSGRTVTVTSHGTPVARIVPIAARGTSPGAKAALLARLRGAPVVTTGPWSRDELYEEGV